MWFKNKEVEELKEKVRALEHVLMRKSIDFSEITYRLDEFRDEYRRSLGGVMDAAGIEFYQEEPKSGYRKKQAVQ